MAVSNSGACNNSKSWPTRRFTRWPGTELNRRAESITNRINWLCRGPLGDLSGAEQNLEAGEDYTPALAGCASSR